MLDYLKEFEGKQVKFDVAFDSAIVNGGAAPNRFFGVLEKYSDSYCIFSNVKASDGVKMNGDERQKDFSNKVAISSKYIILIAEA